jgi:hypothetical protein
MLGGNPEFMAAAALTQKGLSPVEDPEATKPRGQQHLEQAAGCCEGRAR